MSNSGYAKHQSDEQLAAAARGGDARALDALLSRYKPLVSARAATYYLTGGDRDDLVQEGMLGLLSAAREFDPMQGGVFAPFAHLCVTRRILSAIKSAARLKHTPLNDSVSLYAAVNSEDAKQNALTYLDILGAPRADDPEALLISREDLDDLGGKLRERLSPMERRVLTAYLRGERRLDIAEAMGKDIKSIDNAIGRVRQKIEGILASR